MKATFTKLVTLILIVPLLLSMRTSPIRMGIIPFAPYYYTTEQGEQRGWLYNAVKKISQKMGRVLRTSDLSPKRAVKELALGNIDFIIAINTFPGLAKVAHIGKRSLTTIRLAAYSRKGTPPMNEYSDLIGKEAIIIKGYNYGGLVEFIKDRKNKITHHVAENHKLGLKMMQHQRADYLLAYKGPTDMALKTVKIANLSYSILKELQLFFIFSKKLTNGKMVLRNYEELYTGAPR